LRDLVAHDKAGERIVWECAQRRMETLRYPVSIYKNNTDFHGASYGTHECYLMRRDISADAVIRGLIPFFATRQIYAGAGKVGVEVDKSAAIFQMSQRADYFSVEASVDTLHNRPLVNTRDEPHATPSRYRRLHVIIGDANMSEWATAVKVGVTSLVISLIEDGWAPSFDLKHPLKALKDVSRDQTYKWKVELSDGYTLSAVALQRRYLSEAKRRFSGSSADTDWTLAEWELVLNDLEADPTRLKDRVDWAAKRQLLQQFMENEGLTWADGTMQSLDLAYHDTDPETGLYYGLLEAGEMRRIVTDGRIEAAMSCAPADTRAFIRGEFVKRFGGAVRSVGWNGVSFEHNGENLLLDMNPLVEENVRLLNEEIAGAESLFEVIAAIRQSKPADEAAS
jgi:Pup amidohydrolase